MRARVQELPADQRRCMAVHAVADDRVPDRGEVHADLVRASGLRPRLHERYAVEAARPRVYDVTESRPPSTIAIR